MKKLKLLSIVLCCVIAFTAAACVSTGDSPLFDETPPWGQTAETCSESAEYNFSRYMRIDNPDPQYIFADEDITKGYKLNTTGKLNYSIKEGMSVSVSADDSGNPVTTEVAKSNHTLIKMVFTTVYKDDLNHASAAIHRDLAGRTDTMVSYSVVDRYMLNSLFSYKNYQETKLGSVTGTNSFVLTTDYTGDFTGSRTAVLRRNEKTTTVSVKSGEYYDSESVYFQVRAMRTVAQEGGGERSFKLSSPYDAAINSDKKLKPMSAKQYTPSEKIGIKLNTPLRDVFQLPEDYDLAAEDFYLDCFNTSLALTTKKPGPDINLYYSAYPVRKNNTQGRLVAANKVLVKIAYPNHDKLTNAIYDQEYVLTSYSNSY